MLTEVLCKMQQFVYGKGEVCPMNDIVLKGILQEMARQSEGGIDSDRKAMNSTYLYHSAKIAELPRCNLLDASEINKRSLEYFQACSDDGIRPSLTGLALAMGTTVKGFQGLFSDRRMPEECINALGKAAAKVEDVTISLMLDTRVQPVTGLFILKNHFGYKDASDVNINTIRKGGETAQELAEKYKSVVGES